MQILAIDRMKKEVSDAELNQHLPEELMATIKLYLEEKIRNFYFRKDRPGVIFFMETESLEEAKATLDKLPMVKEGILDFD